MHTQAILQILEARLCKSCGSRGVPGSMICLACARGLTADQLVEKTVLFELQARFTDCREANSTP